MINELGNVFVMNAHPLSIFLIMFAMMFATMFWFFVLPFGKAKKISIITLVLGATISTFCFFNGLKLLGSGGAAIVLFLWLTPAVLVWKSRKYFTDLDQRVLVGLQVFRLVGGLFIVEMLRGYVPFAFAVAAGVGDLIVGLTAAVLIFMYKKVPYWAVVLVLIIGVIDFISAITFGITSQPNPLQIFAVGFSNQVNLFPTGLIPLFLVPYAIVFHVLSFINLNNVKK